jgi:hypothetical protein
MPRRRSNALHTLLDPRIVEKNSHDDLVGTDPSCRFGSLQKTLILT